jgi:two-component system cell cycle response regulator
MVGSSVFCDRLSQRARSLATVRLLQANTLEKAKASLGETPPDLLIIQARDPALWHLCPYLRQERSLRWVYCLLLEDGPYPPQSSGRDILQRQTEQTARALDHGADSYLWLPRENHPEGDAKPNKKDLSGDDLSPAIASDSDRILGQALQVYLQQGKARLRVYQELSKANDLLSAIALVDALTQLGNRRAFDWELPRQIEAARHEQRPLSLIIVDIDHFKMVNDRHGHLIGDEVLRLFADRLRHNMRFYDTPFRYGGEEFVIVLQATPMQEARQVAERIRQLVSLTPFVTASDLTLSITVSVGVATLQANDDGKGFDLLHRADLRLLKAKKNGRDQVVVH